MRRLSLPVLLSVCLAVACSTPSSTPATDAGDTTKLDGGADAGVTTDAGPRDAGAVDAGWTYDCPLEGCQVADPYCLAFEDYRGKTPALLRMAELTIKQPAVLTDGLLGSIVNNSILPDAMDCSMNGSGAASWLIEFEKTNEGTTIKTGSGRMDLNDGSYTFVDEDVVFGGSPVPVQPRTLTATLNSKGEFATTQTGDVTIMVPNKNGTPLAMLPLQGVSLSGTITASRNCIGRYQAEQLDTDLACAPEEPNKFFEPWGTVEGYILLEEADTLYLTPLQQSLCVVLSGDATKYGNDKTPQRCRRDNNGNIVYQGNWCSDTNAAAAGDCADAVRLTGSFAASAVVAGETVTR